MDPAALPARNALLAALVVAATGLPAQAAFQPDLRSLQAVPRHVLPPAEVRRAIGKAPRKDRPYHFAVAIAAGIGLDGGLWDAPEPGWLRWRVRIHSADARSLSLHFTPLELPTGAELRVHDAGAGLVHGPYTQGKHPAGGLWTPIVPGDEIVVEVRVPEARATALKLAVGHAYHGYRDWNPVIPEKSGACNIDAVCPEGEVWRDEIRSVARIQISSGSLGSVLCSGQLVNNVRQDLAPFFLTADHCGIGDADGGPAESVVFYFNYQSSQCGGARDGQLTQTLTGSRFLADDVGSDFTLVRLLQSPPDTYQVYYAGWNALGEGSECGAGIHHPSGDEKAISLYGAPLSATTVSIGTGRNVEAWRVVWSDGTTEQGSSGSGLWNRAHQLVGVLSGGTASCSQQASPDYYGRLDVAWTADTSDDGQLKRHLDPDNTGARAIPGRDPARSPLPLSFVPEAGCAGAGSGGGLPAASLALLVLLTLALRLTGRVR